MFIKIILQRHDTFHSNRPARPVKGGGDLEHAPSLKRFDRRLHCELHCGLR